MKLTNEEKLKLVMGKDCWHTNDLDGKLYKVRVSDATIGIRCPIDPTDDSKGTHASIAYPSVATLANSWDNNLSYMLGKAVANDAIDLGIDIILGPGVNIKRIPTCGRNFEYFSEDPHLAGMMAREYIKGAQDTHIGTCIKHYCCNNIEYGRHWISSDVDKQTLYEIYLKQFEIAMEAKPYSLMCSYNLVNGTRMSENEELYNVLYDQFGFNGAIISDWGAVKNATKTVNAGLSLIMPYEDYLKDELEISLKDNKIDLDKLDYAANKVLELIDRCNNDSKLRKVTMSVKQRETLGQTICEEGSVLLKNNGILPLDNKKKIVVTGAPVYRYYFGGGSSNVIPTKPYRNLVDCLKEVGIDCSYASSIFYTDGHQSGMDNLPSFLNALKESDLAVICVGNPCSCECEGRDRNNIKLTNEEEDLIKFALETKKEIVVVIHAGSAIDMSSFKDKVDAILYVGYGGQNANQAIANILSGMVNPSGKLTETFPLKLEDVKAFNSPHDGYAFHYDEKLQVGYRYFTTNNIDVLFPFGYGLSYSKFEYSNLEIIENNESYDVFFNVSNLSDIDGKEVSQAYVRLVDNKDRPLRELKGYTKELIKANTTKKCHIIIRKKDLKYYDKDMNIHYFNDSRFVIEIGKNVNEIVLSKEL